MHVQSDQLDEITVYIFLFMQKRESYKGWNTIFWILQVLYMCRDCQNIKSLYYTGKCCKLKCTSREYEYRILCIPGWLQWKLMLHLTVRPGTYLDSMSVQSSNTLICFKYDDALLHEIGLMWLLVSHARCKLVGRLYTVA